MGEDNKSLVQGQRINVAYLVKTSDGCIVDPLIDTWTVGEWLESMCIRWHKRVYLSDSWTSY